MCPSVFNLGDFIIKDNKDPLLFIIPFDNVFMYQVSQKTPVSEVTLLYLYWRFFLGNPEVVHFKLLLVFNCSNLGEKKQEKISKKNNSLTLFNV